MSDVVFIGVLPPPVHGAALVTSRMLSELQAIAEVSVVPFTRPPSSGVATAALLRANSTLAATKLAITERGATMYVALPGGSSAAALIAPLAAARAARKRIFLHHHAFFYLDRHDRLFDAVFRAAGPDAVHIVLCERMAEMLADRYGVAKTRLLSNLAFIRPPEANPSESARTRDDQYVIGHLSNLSIAKGLDVLLEMYEQMSSDDQSLRLLLGGPADTDAEAKLVREYMARLPGIEWVGPIAQSELAGFFDNIDVFVLPSRSEAAPLVVLEAASFGVMSVTSDRGCLPSVSSVVTVPAPAGIPDAIAQVREHKLSRDAVAQRTADEITFWRGRLHELCAEIATA